MLFGLACTFDNVEVKGLKKFVHLNFFNEKSDFATVMIINAGQLNEYVDRAIMTMKKGEEAIVTINSHSMFYEIKLVDFNKVFFF